MEDPLDVRRARAMMIEQLERAAVNGDTLLPASRVLEGVRSFELDPPCPLDHDQLLVYGMPSSPLFTNLSCQTGRRRSSSTGCAPSRPLFKGSLSPAERPEA